MLKVTLDGDPQGKEYVLLDVQIGFKVVKALIPLSTVMRGVKTYEAYEESADKGMEIMKC